MGKRSGKPRYKPYNVGEYRLNWFGDQFAAVWQEDGTRRRYRLGETTEESARSALHAFARQRQRLIVETDDTLNRLATAYIADRREDGKRTPKMEWTWKALAPTFGPLRAPDITRTLCRTYAETRRALGRAENTINTELRQLRAIVNWAAKAQLIAAAPHIWTPPAAPARDRHLTREEVARVMSAAEQPHVRLFIVLAIATAARMQAILGLEWNRVDFRRGLINLRDPELAETSKGRALVPMNDSARAALIEAKAGAQSDHVIEWGARRVGSIKKGLGRALERAGLRVKGDGAHLLRHSAAVWMAEDGVPMTEISQYLGHTSTAVTERIYARYSPNYLRKAASSLNLTTARAVGS
jgi:integrase